VRPGALAPFFAAAALFHLAAIFSRFDLLAPLLPAGWAEGILLAHFPLLFVEGALEGRIDYGERMADFPLWMRIRSRPVRWAFALAFTYLGVVALQTWDLSIGPVDPSPPASFSPGMRLYFFAMMSVGMFFPNYLAACAVLIPGLRILTRPLRGLPLVAAVPLAALAGLTAGYGVTAALDSAGLGEAIAALQAQIFERPLPALVFIFAVTLLPLAFSALLERRRS
jgi:hypothetical protein